MNQSKVFLNTPSALGIFNTRFFELMATKSLILCPEDSSYGSFLHNQVNCLMFKPDLSDFKKTLTMAIEDDALRECLVANACDGVKKHSYENRIIDLLDRLTLIRH
jgi:spore maturation protein CgeB